MNLFMREMKANLKALIIWCIGMFLGVLSGMGKYTAYSASGQGNELFSALPPSIKALLGFGSLDITSMSGFYAMLFLYLELAVAIHAVLLGAGIIAKEERDKTAEFLMVKPLSRNSVISAKLLSALVNVVVLNVVTFASSAFFAAAYNKGKNITGEVTWFMLSMLMVQMIFLALGFMLASLLKDPKVSGTLSSGILFTAFIISKITDLTDRVNFLNLLSPFKYFSYERLSKGGGLESGAIGGSLVLIMVFLVFSFVFYRKRDLKI